MAAEAGDELVRKLDAVADPTRRAILAAFQDGRERTVDDVAAEAAVHRSVAFEHLRKLERAGLLVRSVRRGRTGRPAGVYGPAGSPLDVTLPPRRFRFLAGILAAAVDGAGEVGRAAAREAARRRGRDLAARARGTRGALSALRSLGGAYRLRGDLVEVGNCVFAETCRESEGLVCDVHAALLEGCFEAAGTSVRAEPEPVPGGTCSYRLHAVPP